MRLAKLVILSLPFVACVPPPPAMPASRPVTSMVVGTAHRGHLQVADYPLTKLDELLAAFRPDLVLVEIRPTAFAEGRLEDGPLEMSYVTLQARKLGIAVEPIDWYLDADVGQDATDDPEAARAFDEEFGEKERETDSFAPFAVLNGPARARDFLDVENAAARFGLHSNAQWHRRQAWFHRQASAAIATHHARRVASFVGFAHRPELDAWLKTAGAVSVSPLDALVDHPSPLGAAATAGVGDDALQVWKDGIARLTARVEQAAPPLRRRLLAKIRYWEVAVERRGRCCVDDATFNVP